MSIHRVLAVLSVCVIAAIGPRIAVAQTPVTTVPDALFAEIWKEVQAEFAGELAGASGSPARQAVYRKMLERFISDRRFTEQRNTPDYRNALMQLVREMPESSTAQTTNAALTNPGTNQLLERSGFSQLIALAGDFRQLFSADASAVSVNINAVVLFGGEKGGDRSAPYLYSRREGWRRLGGTVTFGAKVPEKAITGVSGIPGFDELFDAFSWDVKYRVYGDRDVRASRWYPLLLGKLGQETELLARLVTLPVDPADIPALLAAAKELLRTSLTAAKDRIATSLQLSVKGAGAHLTQVAGKNKYTLAVMLDKGFSDMDLTANLSWNVAETSGVRLTSFQRQDVQLAIGLTGSVLRNALFDGRSVELSASAKGLLEMDGEDVPTERKNTFHLNATVGIPFQAKAKIPISITWSNDPNNLTKEKYVSGQIGFSYDFGGLGDLFKGTK